MKKAAIGLIAIGASVLCGTTGILGAVGLFPR
jgi:hypothetical protein